MSPKEEARIRAAAQRRAAELPPWGPATKRTVTALLASAIREVDEGEAGAA